MCEVMNQTKPDSPKQHLRSTNSPPLRFLGKEPDQENDTTLPQRLFHPASTFEAGDTALAGGREYTRQVHASHV